MDPVHVYYWGIPQVLHQINFRVQRTSKAYSAYNLAGGQKEDK